jgi:hypothetical protein
MQRDAIIYYTSSKFCCQIMKNEGATPLHPVLAAKITYTQQPTTS